MRSIWKTHGSCIKSPIFIRRPGGALCKLLSPVFPGRLPSSRTAALDSSASPGLRSCVRNEALCTNLLSVGCQHKDLGFRLFGCWEGSQLQQAVGRCGRRIKSVGVAFEAMRDRSRVAIAAPDIYLRRRVATRSPRPSTGTSDPKPLRRRNLTPLVLRPRARRVCRARVPCTPYPGRSLRATRQTRRIKLSVSAKCARYRKPAVWPGAAVESLVRMLA